MIAQEKKKTKTKKKAKEPKIIEMPVVNNNTDYLVAYKSSVYITNGSETVPLYEEKIFADILTLENNFGINKALIDGFKNIIVHSIENTVSPSLSNGYTTDVEIVILSITKLEG